jgi:hypothetical protein
MAAPKAFLSTRRVSSAAVSAELAQHATRFLRRVAHDMHLSSREFDIKATRASAKRRQYITLSTESFFLDVQDTARGTTVAISYRTRRGKLDPSGVGSNFIAVEQIDTAHRYQRKLRITSSNCDFFGDVFIGYFLH